MSDERDTRSAPEASSADATSVPRPQNSEGDEPAGLRAGEGASESSSPKSPSEFVTCPTCKEQARPAFRCGRCGTFIRIHTPPRPKPSIVERTTTNPPYGELPESF